MLRFYIPVIKFKQLTMSIIRLLFQEGGKYGKTHVFL